MSSEMPQMLGTYVSVLAAVQARLGTDPAAAALFNRGVRDARALPPHVWERWAEFSLG